MGAYKALFKDIEKYPKTQFLEAILRDIDNPSENEGQLVKAVSSEEWFKKWGLNFLLSFIRSHTLQTCGNFKDLSIQGYGGELFQANQIKSN